MKIGSIVQLNPETCRNPMFAACMLVVTETRSWGVIGYVQALGDGGQSGGRAYYRAQHDEVVDTNGIACWMPETEKDDQ